MEWIIKSLIPQTEQLVKEGKIEIVKDNWREFYLYKWEWKIVEINKKSDWYEVIYEYIWKNWKWLIQLYKKWKMLDWELRLLPEEIIKWNDLKVGKIVNCDVWIDRETWEHEKIIYYDIKLNKEEFDQDIYYENNIEFKNIEEIMKELLDEEDMKDYKEIIEEIKDNCNKK